MSLQIVILAAGQGKRMYSATPKVLHQLAGKSMLERVVDTAQALHPDAIHLIYGHGGEQLKAALPELPVNWVHQQEQSGTGHAVMQALPFIPESAKVLILSADVPLIEASTLDALIQNTQNLNLLVAVLDNPFGLGRILRDDNGQITAIVEEKDATEAEKNIREIYSGICCAQASDLARWLPALGNDNAQGEYYLTSIISMAVAEGQRIESLQVGDPMQIQGVNNRLQLQELERVWQTRHAEQLLLSGVMLADAKRIDLRGELICGRDVFIDINAVFNGKVSLGDGCHIGPNCVLSNVSIGKDCRIHPNSVLDNAIIGDHCEIGPFARLRPGTNLAAHCKIGNFVEIKNTHFDEGSKASHLSYIGDATIGREVNIGAGTITCNYDGANKHQTIIDDGAFIGSGTELVAPIRIGANATIGAGSTLRANAPAETLTLTKTPQRSIEGWKRPVKKL